MSSRPVGFPAAVLIRSLEGIKGPGRLTKAIGITRELNGMDASTETGVWFTDRLRLRAKNLDFAQKRKVIFTTTNNQAFAITNDLTNYETWSEAELSERLVRVST